MKLASLKHGRDGRLVLVSSDLAWFTDAFLIAPTLQAALMTLSPALPSETPDGQPLRLLFAFRGLPEGSGGVELVLRATRLARPAVTAAVCAAASPEEARSALEREEAGWL